MEHEAATCVVGESVPPAAVVRYSRLYALLLINWSEHRFESMYSFAYWSQVGYQRDLTV